MVKLNIKKLLGLRNLNCISEQELKDDLNNFEKKDFIDFLTALPKENLAYLFEEAQKIEGKEDEELNF